MIVITHTCVTLTACVPRVLTETMTCGIDIELRKQNLDLYIGVNLGHWAEKKRGAVWAGSGVLYTLFRTKCSQTG